MDGEIIHLINSLPQANIFELHEFYGSPAAEPHPEVRGKILVNEEWARENLQLVPIAELPYFPPFNGQDVSGVTVHKKIAPLLKATWGEILRRGLADRLSTYDGAYYPRHVMWNPRNALSMHAYGVALDFDARWNGYGVPPSEAQIDREVVKVFEEFGWSWGGRWNIPDAMHFEAVAPRTGVNWQIEPTHDEVPPQPTGPYNRVVILFDRKPVKVLRVPLGYRVFTHADLDGGAMWVDVRRPDEDTS